MQAKREATWASSAEMNGQAAALTRGRFERMTEPRCERLPCLIAFLSALISCLHSAECPRSPTQRRLSRSPGITGQESGRRGRSVRADGERGPRSITVSAGGQFLLSLGTDRTGRRITDRAGCGSQATSTGSPLHRDSFSSSPQPAQEKFTGPKLGAENPDAPKITGFDRVEEMDKLPEEVIESDSRRGIR